MSDTFVKFECPCPICKNIENIYWEHTIDDSHEEINLEGDIKCNNSSCHRHKEPLFIMGWGFNCGNHISKNGTDFIQPDKTRALAAMHMVANNADLTFTQEQEDYFIKKVLNYKK